MDQNIDSLNNCQLSRINSWSGAKKNSSLSIIEGALVGVEDDEIDGMRTHSELF